MISMHINPLVILLPLLPILGPFGYLTLFLSRSLRSTYVNKLALPLVFFLSSLFVLLFIIYENSVFLRTAFFVIGAVFARQVILILQYQSSKKIINSIFFTNIILILAEAALYQFGVVVFSSAGRFGGILGYDFVAFLMGTYLLYLIGTNIERQAKVFMASFIAVTVTLLSGRFGVLVLGFVGLALLAIRRPNLRFYLLSLVLILLIGFGFKDQLVFTFSSIEVLFTSQGAIPEAYELVDGMNSGGYYTASPITWLNEFLSAFTHWPAVFMPQKSLVLIDSGPAFLTANGGIFLWLFYCIFSALLLAPKGKLQWALLLVWFLVDLKFRCLLSPFPTIWMLLLFLSMRKNYHPNPRVETGSKLREELAGAS